MQIQGFSRPVGLEIKKSPSSLAIYPGSPWIMVETNKGTLYLRMLHYLNLLNRLTQSGAFISICSFGKRKYSILSVINESVSQRQLQNNSQPSNGPKLTNVFIGQVRTCSKLCTIKRRAIVQILTPFFLQQKWTTNARQFSGWVLLSFWTEALPTWSSTAMRELCYLSQTSLLPPPQWSLHKLHHTLKS